MLLSIGVFLLVAMVCSGGPPAGGAGIQNSKSTFIAAGDSYNNRIKRSPEPDAGAAAENYLLDKAVRVKILPDSIIYKKVGGFNRAVADFDYLKPEHTTATKWEQFGLIHIIGQVGDRVLIFTIDDAKKTPILVLTKIHPVTGGIFSQKFVYTSSNEMDTF